MDRSGVNAVIREITAGSRQSLLNFMQLDTRTKDTRISQVTDSGVKEVMVLFTLAPYSPLTVMVKRVVACP